MHWKWRMRAPCWMFFLRMRHLVPCHDRKYLESWPIEREIWSTNQKIATRFCSWTFSYLILYFNFFLIFYIFFFFSCSFSETFVLLFFFSDWATPALNSIFSSDLFLTYLVSFISLWCSEHFFPFLFLPCPLHSHKSFYILLGNSSL